MKELSIKEKAKRYDKAVINGSRLWECGDITRENYEYIFPELAESEDERTWIINYLSNMELNSSIIAEKENLKKAIAWLAKQGEQKPVVIIPKFRVNDEIKTVNEESLTITKIDEKGYWSENLFICDFNEECLWDLVEQKSAWSEEDEENLNWFEKFFRAESVVAGGKDIPQDRYLWFKNLKDRIQPQNRWKPSDEQIKVCKEVYADILSAKSFDLGTVNGELNRLEEELKKLKG